MEPTAKKGKEPSKNDLLALPSSIEEYETAFQGRIKSYFIRSNDNSDLNIFLASCRPKIYALIRSHLESNTSVKVNVVCECFFENSVGENLDAAFKTKNKSVYEDTDINDLLETMFRKLIVEMEEAQMKKSGWMLIGVDGIRVRVNRHDPLRGSCHIPLPTSIASKKACINVRNSDQGCFKFAILAKFVEKDPQRISKYAALMEKYNFSCVGTPTTLREIRIFEKGNNISINVYGLDEKENVYPLKVCDEVKIDHRDILLVENDESWHYVYIKSFEKLVRKQKTSHHGTVEVCRKCFTHFDNQYKPAQEKLLIHHEYCKLNKPMRIELPVDDPILKFKHVERQIRVPYVVYADFEAILHPVDNSTTGIYQTHEPMSFCAHVKTSLEDDELIPQEPYIYRGLDAPKKFWEYLQNLAKVISNKYSRNVPIIMRSADNKEWMDAVYCYLCEGKFNEKNVKVRDHCHITGKYRGASCNNCNLLCRTPTFVPVIMHNLSGYDSHFIVKEMGFSDSRVEVIPNTEEKYISFTKHLCGLKFRFIDSYRFMSSSLDQLVLNLPANDFKETSRFYTGNKLDLVRRKGVFPYDYVDSWDKLEEEQLPSREDFFNNLTESQISEGDYEHAQNVWRTFEHNNLGEYSDHYLKTDVLLLCDVFESFRNMTLKTHKLDPAHYFTSPGMTWDAMLRFTGVKLELLLDYDMLLMFEQGIRGGLCQVSHRFAQSNNKYMKTYDETRETWFITYLDANNLYAHAMCRFLPYGDFKWVNLPEELNLEELEEDSDYGYVLEVDVSYPAKLHELHNDMPFLPESRTPPGSKFKKLIAHLGEKRKYVVHYVALKQAIQHGLRVTKIHRAIRFRQSRWLQSYIDFNTQLRTNATNQFEKDQYKMYNNAVFGKTMEAIRKRLNIELVTNPKRLEKLIAKPNFIDRTIYGETLAAVHMEKTKLLFNKPIYVGMCILDLSKTVMYKFHYDVMLQRYDRSCIKLLYTDTDSTIYHIRTSDIYKDFIGMQEELDTSDYPKTHPSHSAKNKKVPGKFKDEVNGKIIEKFIGLRPKMYALNVEGDIKKKAKGVQNSALNKFISIEDYEATLFSQIPHSTIVRNIRSHHHNLVTTKTNKISLSALDDKRIILEDMISTKAYGYVDNAL